MDKITQQETIINNLQNRLDKQYAEYNKLVDKICALTPCEHAEDALRFIRDSRLIDQTPFCYMTETYEVGLFDKPPEPGSEWADMFPVYRHPAIDAERTK